MNQTRARVESLTRAGVAPTRARRPTLLDEWDLVRAAEHLIQVHGSRAVEVAEQRAQGTRDLDHHRRWNAIGNAVRELMKA